MEPTRTRDDALANPGLANSEINAAIDSAGANDAPVIEDPADDLVNFPGGLVRGGKVIRTAQVRELNGSDEEALSRALQSGSAFHFMDTLIERGTVSVGGVAADRDLLKSLLIGDRDELALSIRRVTYGQEMEIEQWVCPACGSMSDIKFTLTDDVINRVTLKDPAEDGVFEVPLRKGATARVRLPNGADQEAIWTDTSWTTAQRNTVLLSRCVMTYTDPAGQSFNVAAFPSIARNLTIPDRAKILREVTRRQPGPRYNEVKFTHDECKNEVTLALGVRDLFRDLLLFL